MVKTMFFFNHFFINNIFMIVVMIFNFFTYDWYNMFYTMMEFFFFSTIDSFFIDYFTFVI